MREEITQSVAEHWNGQQHFKLLRAKAKDYTTFSIDIKALRRQYVKLGQDGDRQNVDSLIGGCRETAADAGAGTGEADTLRLHRARRLVYFRMDYSRVYREMGPH
ncbi:hypothetical protein ACJJTC_003844 [Scirpophaga incertulas]